LYYIDEWEIRQNIKQPLDAILQAAYGLCLN